MRAATGGKDNKSFEWTEEMENEFQFLKKTMKLSLKLSPYNPEQKLRLIIDGSRTIGTGFILIQYINDDNVKDQHNYHRNVNSVLWKLNVLSWIGRWSHAITGYTIALKWS